MIKWIDTFEEQVRSMSDKELLELYHASSGIAGEPVCDAFCAEIERRNLDI